MGNSRNTGYLQNTVKVADNGDISLMHGSTMLMQISSSGAITTTGVISGSNALSASYAATASFVTLAQTASFVTTAQTASFVTLAQTASFVANAQSASNAVTAQTASFANTFTVASTLTAQTLVVQTITSSVVYSSGSNIFGNNIANTQILTGSVSVTGSLAVVTNGTEFQVTNTGVRLGNALTDTHPITGSVLISSGSVFNVGRTDAGYPFTVASQFAKTDTTGRGLMFLGSNEAYASNPFGLVVTVTGASTLANRYVQVGTTDFGSANGGNLIFQGSSGNVGIGTTNPATHATASGLVVAGTGGNRGIIEVWDNSATAGKAVFQNVGGITYVGSLSSGSGAGTLVLLSGGNGNTARESVTITNTGATTFANTTAGYGITLNHTSENLRLKMGAIAGGIINIQGEVISSGNSYSLVLNYLGGNIGIGSNNSPAYQLDITGIDNSATSTYLRVYSNNRTVWTGIGYQRLETNGSLSIVSGDVTYFRNGGADRMIITSGGNVGIGTANPSRRLTVSKDTEGVAAGLELRVVGGINDGNNDGIFFTQGAAGATPLGSIRAEYKSSGYPDIAIYTRSGASTETSRFSINGANGYVYLGKSWGATNHRINLEVSQGNNILVVSGYSGVGNDTAIFYAVGGANPNGAATALGVTTNSSTGRSINAGGTINGSGVDYAEYIEKAVTDTIAKGDIVGINSDAKLTNIFADAISFVVKSTNPSYVGGDDWGSVVGKRPERTIDQTEEEFAPILAEFEARLEAARQKVDRIAFSGQVPCNVTGANVGDYIIPIELENGKIGGQAISNPTFDQFKLAVGKVWKVMEDGRAWIKVIN